MDEQERDDATQFHVNELRDCTKLSHPDILNCEHDRLTLAQGAVQHFWRLYQAQMIWVGDFLLGRLLYRDQPGLRTAVDPLIDKTRADFDYFFEDIGAMFSINGRRSRLDATESPISVAAQESYERDEWVYRDDIMRQFYIEMTMTTAPDATWAKETQAAMFATNLGGRPKLFQPSKSVHGDAVGLYRVKRLAVGHVRSIAGAGASKLQARLDVGEVIGVSEPTLKAWEAELEKNEYDSFHLHCFELAGFHGAHLETATRQELLDAATTGYGLDEDTVLARHLRQELRDNPLPAIRDALRKARAGT